MPPAKQLAPKYKNPSKLTVRKHLKMDAMPSALHQGFSAVSDSRRGKVDICLADALMSGFAMFSLKDPSLLAFDESHRNDGNLGRIYGWAGQRAPERSLRHADDACLSGRPDPAVDQRPVSIRLAKVRDQALRCGRMSVTSSTSLNWIPWRCSIPPCSTATDNPGLRFSMAIHKVERTPENSSLGALQRPAMQSANCIRRHRKCAQDDEI